MNLDLYTNQLLASSLFEGTISREGERELQAWLMQDQMHVEQLRDWNRIWQQSMRQSDRVDALWADFQKQISNSDKPKVIPLWYRPMVRWAAVACCALFLIVFALHTYLRPATPADNAIATAPVRTSVVATNTIQSVVLPDSSRVVLNRGSQLSYSSDFGQKDRQVMLSGEAYFEVEKDKEKPFVVSADGLKVCVTGTKFNVTAYEQITQTTVTLLEGGVKVTNTSFDADLLPNEQLVYTRESKELVKRMCDGTAAIAWIDGNMDFDYIRLEELMWRLSLMYGEAIGIEGEQIRNRQVHYYMDEQHPLKEVMDAIGEVYKLQIAHSEQGYRVEN